LTKRIPVDEINGEIWFEHGTPTFILELKNTLTGTVYRHSYEFTEDYVKKNTVTINGDKYVEMSYTWTDMPSGKYTSDEISTVRYSLEDVINIEKGTYSTATQTVNFNVGGGEEAKATFYNKKSNYSNYSHNSIVVNEIV
jgi:hypothetical protein